MSDIDLRLECIRMAQMQCPATPVECLLGEAAKLYRFAKFGSDQAPNTPKIEIAA